MPLKDKHFCRLNLKNENLKVDICNSCTVLRIRIQTFFVGSDLDLIKLYGSGSGSDHIKS